MTNKPDLATATAHCAWDERWRIEAGREAWLEPDLDVVGVLPLLRERGVRRVLDLECGVGRHARVLAAEGFETFALDGSEGGIVHLRRAVAADGLVVDLRVGLMTGLPYGNGAFDYVLAFNVIYHGDPTVVARAVAEIHRVLRPGGLYQGTMLSKRHERYGRGTRIAPDTFVLDGTMTRRTRTSIAAPPSWSRCSRASSRSRWSIACTASPARGTGTCWPSGWGRDAGAASS